MRIIETPLQGVLIIEPTVFADERGFFLESFRSDILSSAGINPEFVQANSSRSTKGVLRGLHFQTNHPQGKLVRVSRGCIFDVAVDIRKDSPTFGEYFGTELNDKDHRQLWIPPGFAHGFCTLSEVADFHYQCTDYYDPHGEGGILWNDPEIGIHWPLSNPTLSEKDMVLPNLRTMNDAA